MEEGQKGPVKYGEEGNRRKKYKEPENMVFGTRAVMESIEAGKEVDKLFVQKNLSNDLIKELIQTARRFHIPVSKVPVEKLNRFTRKNHQGVVAFLSAITYASLDNVIDKAYARGDMPLLVVLDRVTDIRNFGAIARSAECAGAHALVIPAKGSAAVNSDAVKTSAGALNHIPVCRVDNLRRTLMYLQDTGIKVVACTEKADHMLYDVDFTEPAAILMGSEEDGIAPELIQQSSDHVKIPLSGQIGSLNVSVATAVSLFEVVRQRGGYE
ncbi:23S rRNA (guanosine(2251)-2'-O)-methyltransferase RlmB [Roseivirga sp. BDSF3-8]|uniref:23S rRNA (guanosine(2251)-2'-O)-methyltransferase RlmB n=1 Tax=Roseivirga sp. BDSF3-8 TaxID=3241598 RepID=UPI003531A482